MGLRDVRHYVRQIGQRRINLGRQNLRRILTTSMLLVFAASGLLAQLSQDGLTFTIPTAHAAAATKPGGKNTFHPSKDLGKAVVPHLGPTQKVTTSHTPQTINRDRGVTMQPFDMTLTPGAASTSSATPTATPGVTPGTTPGATPAAVTPPPATASAAAHAQGSDGRLEVSVPAGAVSAAMAAQAQATGGLKLHVVQLEGPSGGTASGQISFGTYQFTVTDAQGHAVQATLAQPVTLTLHLTGLRGAGMDMAHVVFVVQNTPVSGTMASGTTRATPVATSAAKTTTPATTHVVKAKYDLANQELITPFTVTGGSSTGTWNTNSPNAHIDAQTDTGVDLSGGDLTYAYPLDLPAGPGGFTPKLQLSYDSAGVGEMHNKQAAANWVGEGWNLSLGSISWGEENVTGTCTDKTCNCSGMSCATWENTWSFADAFGNGGELIPSDSNLSNWYDDTTNTAPSGSFIDYNLDNNPRIVVVSYTNPTTNSDFPTANYPHQPPCFRAFLPDGTMEEYGCTRDSLQWYVDSNPVSGEYKGNYVYRWDLDMIVDPNGNQIQITYKQIKNWSKANGSMKFPIDAVISQITYDSPGCHSTTTRCTTWQPAVKVVFDSDFAATRLTGLSCPTFSLSGVYTTGQTMRCDDVHDLSGSSGVAAPELQSLMLLNDVQVQVSNNPTAGTPTWNTLRTYQFSYDQTPSSTVQDAVSNMQESVAGSLVLTKIQEVGDDSSTALPALAMSYTSPISETYIDKYYTVSGTNCTSGPTWNQPNCYLWTRTYNTRFLSELDNGRGWSEAYTWKLAHNNTHGVNTGGTLEDPFACTSALQDGQPQTTPCSTADDQNWSRVVLTQRQATVQCVNAAGGGCGPGGSSNLTSTSTYTYALTDVTKKECSDCNVAMYWGNQNDGDKLDFYNTHFMGFHIVQVTNPDGSEQVYTFNSGEGYGVATSSITCHSANGCAVAPWTDQANALHGQVKEEDDYDTNGTTLLKETVLAYATTCPPSGISGSAHNSSDPTSFYVGQRSSELDRNNPIVVCEVEPSQADTYQLDGGTLANAVHTTTAYTHAYSGVHMTSETEDTTTNDNTLTPHIVKKTQMAWHDAITQTSTSAHGIYIFQMPGIQTTEDGSSHVKACTYTAYDGGTAGAVGSQTTLTAGLVMRTDQYSANCTPGSLSGQVSTLNSYNTNGDIQATKDADAVAGVSGHTTASCTFGSVAYSACASFDANYDTQVKQVTNALAQATALNYTDDAGSTANPDANNGYGQWLTTLTDANTQASTFAYDPLGRLLASASPGDTLSSPTTSYLYPVSCAATGASEPCTALVTTQRLAGSTTVTSAAYYDGWGRQVETVTPESLSGSTCTYKVSYTVYDPSGRKSLVSDPYFVTGTSATCAVSYQRPDTTQPGTVYTYDGLGRVKTTQDGLGNVTNTSYSVDSPTSGANISDTNHYDVTQVVDANSHKTRTLTDGFGYQRYVEQFTGTSSYALYATTRSDYDWLGDVTAVYGPNAGSPGLSTTTQSTATYDLLKRKTAMAEADLGGYALGYDQNGNLTSSIDPRGTGGGGVVYTGYDGLNRQLWRNTTNGPTGAFAAYTYDSTTGGNKGVGRLTGESFTGGATGHVLSGSYSYTYDGRGQATQVTTSVGNNYTLGYSYNDAGQQTSLTYSDGEVFSLNYNAYDWLTDATTTPSGGSTVNLMTGMTYSGVGGAAGHPTAANVGNGTYSYSASYDNDLRPTAMSLSVVSTSATDYATSRGYDAVGNVTSVNSTLGAGTDNQAFCYDEQNRLVWAGSTGLPSCGGSLTSGTLTSAQYTQTFAYDALNRLTSIGSTGATGGPSGTYTYGDVAHLHAATATASAGYSATYDAAGDMICRAPTSTTTCTGGSPTGATLAYDAERRLTQYQNAPTSPSVTAYYLYDGEGNRVQQAVVTGTGTATTTYLPGGVEEVRPDSGVTKYYTAGGMAIGLNTATDASGISYLASDGLGSVSESLDGSGGITSQQLFAPFGATRYTSGVFPTNKGFTGQRSDAQVSGLDYYVSRYYDPLLGQFTSADSVTDGLNRYAYVKGNPETFTDPSGHFFFVNVPWGIANTIETIGTATAFGIPAAIKTIYQLRALKVASKVLNSAGKNLVAQARWPNKASTLRDILDGAYDDVGKFTNSSWEAGSRVARQASRAADEALLRSGNAADFARMAKWGGRLVVGVGALVDLGTTWAGYEQDHSDDPNAGVKGPVYGVLHAGLSTAGGLLGAAIGAAIPIPGLDVAASIGLGMLGSSAGDWVADRIQNGIDGGSLQAAFAGALTFPSF